MTEKQKKTELLRKIAHRLNEAHVQWALGASMLLYFKGITAAFHDMDAIPEQRVPSSFFPSGSISSRPAGSVEQMM